MSFGVIAASVAIASAVGGTYMSIQGQKAAQKAAEMSAKYNADQAKKQAKHEQETATENMRRKRLNNRRAIARQKAVGARSGLTTAGAVGDMLVDTSERLQQDVEDIWKTAETKVEHLNAQANMGLWEAEQSKTASKYAIYGTALSGLGKVASAGADLGGAMAANKAAKAAKAAG